MTIRTVTCLPVDDGLAQSIPQWLTVSNSDGGPLAGKSQEWLRAALAVAKGLKRALATDGVIEVDSK